MGQEAIYKCRNCGNEFKSHEGGGFNFYEYRCVNCDTVKAVQAPKPSAKSAKYQLPSQKDIGVCDKCNGSLKRDIKPMCKKCKSRDVEVKETLIFYD